MWLNSKALKICQAENCYSFKRFWFEDIDGKESHAEDLTTLKCSVLHAVIDEMCIGHEHNDKDGGTSIPAAFRYTFSLLILGKLFKIAADNSDLAANFGCNITSHFSSHYFILNIIFHFKM